MTHTAGQGKRVSRARTSGDWHDAAWRIRTPVWGTDPVSAQPALDQATRARNMNQKKSFCAFERSWLVDDDPAN